MRSLTRLFLFLISLALLNSCQKEPAQLVPLGTTHVPVADAGPSRVITLPVTTTTLNGTGSSQNGRIVGYLWSLISGPNVPLIHSPSSPNTNISGLIAGTYYFQFMVIDSLGYTGVDTTSVRVIPGSTTTLSLQPTNNPNEMNFAEWGGTNASSQVIDDDAGSWTWNGLSLTARGAIKFDLSSIPPGSTIISAKLSLYSNPTPVNGDLINANSGPNNSMWIRRLVSNWTGGTTTWAQQPATETSTQVLIPHTSQSFFDLIDIDVKNTVTSMMTNGNYGFMMGLQNEVIYNIRQFASSRHPDATKHPKLVVVYQ